MEKDIKTIVQEKYGSIARQNAEGCCDPSCCSDSYTDMSENYEHLKGYNKDADLKLGCGLPTEFAKIQPGDTVVDLGSGAGNDCFIARAETGESGMVIGVDFTTDMIEKARSNANKLGYQNVSFVFGDIEQIPLQDNLADVVVSNCVFNLVPDKEKAFRETFRILKPGGHFSISDIVIEGELPQALREDAEMYVGCVAGASQKTEYLELIAKTGFHSIEIQKQRPLELPDDILNKYLTPEQIKQFNSSFGIYSITVYAVK